MTNLLCCRGPQQKWKKQNKTQRDVQLRVALLKRGHALLWLFMIWSSTTGLSPKSHWSEWRVHSQLCFKLELLSLLVANSHPEIEKKTKQKSLDIQWQWWPIFKQLWSNEINIVVNLNGLMGRFLVMSSFLCHILSYGPRYCNTLVGSVTAILLQQ